MRKLSITLILLLFTLVGCSKENINDDESKKLLNSQKYEEELLKKAEADLANIGEVLYKERVISKVQLAEYADSVKKERNKVEEIKLSLNSLSLAVLRSVGMSKQQIIKMIFIKSLTGGLIGGIIGVIGGILKKPYIFWMCLAVTELTTVSRLYFNLCLLKW
ncbi:MAG: hypothetical protein APF81_07955 [Desulfosporosinus sp. BRH_c37]|nr:MAG: hypothetical protein APF81_07955 [Desulfosporosinus sp. BRH_c37]